MCFIRRHAISAARGAVSFSISYRLLKADGPSVGKGIEDCKSAIRFIRTHAADFGIDPQRIVVAGDSAGGHLAACLGTLDGFDAADEDLKISARADVMVLFNPIVDMTDGGWLRSAVGGKYLIEKKLPVPATPENLAIARSLSPLCHVHSNQPPTLLMHGLERHNCFADQARQFAAAMTAAGNPLRPDFAGARTPRVRGAAIPGDRAGSRQRDVPDGSIFDFAEIAHWPADFGNFQNAGWIPIGAVTNTLPTRSLN